MPSNTVTMMELAAHFGMKTLVGSIKAISRTIAAPETDRPGPEIMGFWTDHEPQRISLIGNKEMSLISMIEPDELYKNFENFVILRVLELLFAKDLSALKLCLRQLQRKIVLYFRQSQVHLIFSTIYWITYLTD